MKKGVRLIDIKEIDAINALCISINAEESLVDSFRTLLTCFHISHSIAGPNDSDKEYFIITLAKTQIEPIETAVTHLLENTPDVVNPKDFEEVSLIKEYIVKISELVKTAININTLSILFSKDLAVEETDIIFNQLASEEAYVENTAANLEWVRNENNEK